MEDKILIVYSSRTGNTKSVGDQIIKVIPKISTMVSVKNIDKVNIEKYNIIIVGFWADKSNADRNMQKFIKRLRNKKLIYFGTMGVGLESKYAEKIRNRVDSLCNEHNELLGGFLCQGKIDPKYLKLLDKFPIKLFHSFDKEEIAMFKEADNHPNEKDFINAQNFIKEILKMPVS